MSNVEQVMQYAEDKLAEIFGDDSNVLYRVKRGPLSINNKPDSVSISIFGAYKQIKYDGLIDRNAPHVLMMMHMDGPKYKLEFLSGHYNLPSTKGVARKVNDPYKAIDKSLKWVADNRDAFIVPEDAKVEVQRLVY